MSIVQDNPIRKVQREPNHLSSLRGTHNIGPGRPTRQQRLANILLLPESTRIEEYGIKPDRFTGPLGTLRKHFTSEGQEYKQRRERYKKAPYIHLPLAERSVEVETDIYEWTRLQDKIDANISTPAERKEHKRLEDKLAGPIDLMLQAKPQWNPVALHHFKYDFGRTSRGDDIVYAPFVPTEEHYITHGSHASALLTQPNGTTEFFNPWGTSINYKTPSNYREAVKESPGLFHSANQIQTNSPLCFPITLHRILKHPEPAGQYYRKLIEAADRLGVDKQIVPSLINESMRADREAGIPQRRTYVAQEEYKKGGIVQVAKESYSKTPEDIGDYKLIKKTPTMLLYKHNDNYVVSVRGTKDFTDVKADLAIPFNQLKNTKRFKKDLQTLLDFKKEHPNGNWTGVGHSLGGAILDEFLHQKLIDKATTYNPAIEPQYLQSPSNERHFVKGDPLHTVGQFSKAIVHNPSFKFSLGRIADAVRSHSLENFSDTDTNMRHQITAVPLVEKKKLGMDGKGQKPRMKKGGLVEKVKRVAKKAKEVAETVGRAVVKEAKKHSHHLIEAGKQAGAVAGTALGTASVETVGPMAIPAGKYVGEKAGEFIGRKIHEGIQSLKKGGKVKKLKESMDELIKKEDDAIRKAERRDKTLGSQRNLSTIRERKLKQVADTMPSKHKATVAKKKQSLKEGGQVKAPSAWMSHVKAYRAEHGGSYKDAMKGAKATYKK